MTQSDSAPRPLPRLEAAAALVPPGSRVADIGSGHGLLPRLLLLSGRASFCVAGELNARTLSLVQPLPADRPGAGRLELRAGDGLSILTPEDRIDVALLLGMGTRTIQRILDAPGVAELAIPRFVFQPQTDWAGLRAALPARGLALEDERLVRDRGRVYLLLAAGRGGVKPPPLHPGLSPRELLEVGPFLVRSGDPLVREVWNREHRRRSRIASRATAGDRPEAQAAVERAERILAALDERPGAPPGRPRGRGFAGLI